MWLDLRFSFCVNTGIGKNLNCVLSPDIQVLEAGDTDTQMFTEINREKLHKMIALEQKIYADDGIAKDDQEKKLKYNWFNMKQI